jgi:hypothetical protein
MIRWLKSLYAARQEALSQDELDATELFLSQHDDDSASMLADKSVSYEALAPNFNVSINPLRMDEKGRLWSHGVPYNPEEWTQDELDALELEWAPRCGLWVDPGPPLPTPKPYSEFALRPPTLSYGELSDLVRRVRKPSDV